MKKTDSNVECEIIFEESIKDTEEELQVVYDSYRDTPKEVYEERFEAITSKLYEAQEVAVWERVEKNREASRNAHDEAHEDRDEEAVIPSHDVPQEVYANRWNQRDPYKVSFNKIWSSQNNASYHKELEDAQENNYEDIGNGLDGIFADKEALGGILKANGVYAHENEYKYEETYGKFAQRFEPGSINDSEGAEYGTETEAGDTDEAQKDSKSQGDNGNQIVLKHGNQRVYIKVSEEGFDDKV